MATVTPSFRQVPLAAFIVCILTASAAAQLKVNALYPSGGQRGAKVDVALSGSFPIWPLSAEWRGGQVKLECGDKGKVLFTVEADAAPGPRWVRFYDAKGASQWRCFVVGQLPEVVETEPNESPESDKLTKLPVVVNGKLQKSGDVDVFAVELSEQHTLVASVEAKRRLGSAIDCVIQVCDSNGFVLAQNDDSRGVDPLVTFRPRRAGRHLIRVFGFPATPNSSIQFAGAADANYRLTLSQQAVVDYPIPLSASKKASVNVQWRGWNLPDAESHPTPAADDIALLSKKSAAGSFAAPTTDANVIAAAAEASAKTPQVFELPAVISGEIESPRDEDTFQCEVKKGDRIRVAVEAFDLGFALDPLLVVKTAEGKVLKELDDQSRSQRDPTTTVTAPADGSLLIQVRDTHRFGGPRHAYRMSVTRESPDFRLVAASQTVAVDAGKEVELTINIERTAGWKEEIQCAVVGLPAGVTAELLKLDAKAKSGKLKIKAAADAKPFSGSIRVEGKSGERQRTAEYRVDRIPFKSIWLSVVAAKQK